MEQQKSMVENYIKQVGALLGREQESKEERVRLEGRIQELVQELDAVKRSRASHRGERTQMEDKIRQAERHANRWHLKYNQLKNDLTETKDVILMYENLLDKLTEQNVKLKDWIKTKKQQEQQQEQDRSQSALTHIDQLQDVSGCPSPSVKNFDFINSSFKQTRQLYQPTQPNSQHDINSAFNNSVAKPQFMAS